MSKLLIFRFVLVAVLAAGFILAVFVFYSGRMIDVCFEKICFKAAKATNTFQWQKGLMFRQSLGADKGLLFIFDRAGEHSFWMKNTLIPLDIVWLNSRKEVIFIKENVPPCSQDPCPAFKAGKDSLFVLEINAGQVKESNIKVGDRADFDF